jgi:hypothetical protein
VVRKNNKRKFLRRKRASNVNFESKRRCKPATIWDNMSKFKIIAP